MKWHKVAMLVEQVVNGEHMRLQDEFAVIFMAVGGPKDMALFSGIVSKEGLDIYFSPGSISHTKALINTYGGIPCEKPLDKNLALLVGHSDARDRLFREHSK